MEPKDRLIVALDVDSLEKAKPLVEQLHPYVGCFKVGLELIHNVGTPAIYGWFTDYGYDGAGKVFLDVKLMDIPHTVVGAVKPIASKGFRYFNVHCLGGKAMMKAARETTDQVVAENKMSYRPQILGVTILTSLSYDDLVQLGIWSELNIADPKELESIKRLRMERLIARHLAWLAQESGLDGVIASPQEIRAIRAYCQPEFQIVTPGVRPEWASVGDQKRVMTPREAIQAGANALVIGRPITKPPAEIGSPVEAAKRILDEINSA